MKRNWQVSNTIWVPVRRQPSEDHSRLLPVRHHVEGFDFKLSDADVIFSRGKELPELSADGLYESRQLIIRVAAQSVEDAQRKAELPIELFCDQLALAVQGPIRLDTQLIGQADGGGQVLQIPGGAQPPMWRSNQYVNAQPAASVQFSDADELSERQIAALRWYHKALAAKYDVERFIFLWVALEVLFELDGEKVLSHYTAPCGHEIPACPACQRTTEKVVNGPSLKHYLEDKCSVDTMVAVRLWRFRQILHGRYKATHAEATEAAIMNMHLHAAVTRSIVNLLNIDPRAVPTVDPFGPVIGWVGVTTTPN
jgi:hypothetical protein